MINIVKFILNNLRKNELYVLIGAALIALGVTLWCDGSYFFYPPEYMGIMNDDGLDAMGVFIGITLVIYGLFDVQDGKIAGLVLALAVFFVGAITVMQLVHVLAVGQFRMVTNIIGNIFIIAVIMHVARERNTRR